LPNIRAKSVAFLNRFYAPDVAATGQMLSDLAEDLAASGWSVTVITSQTSYDRHGERIKRDEIRRGVRVLRVTSTAFGRGTIAGRMVDYLSYFALSVLTLLRMPQPQVIVAMSDPPFILLGAIVVARLRGATVCYWAQDVYPSLAARLGVLKESGLPFKFFRSLARRLLSACNLIVGLGPQMVKALVEEGAPADRTVCIHNWADENSIVPIPPEDNWFIGANGLEGKFVVLYSGNAGRGHTFDALCEVMERFRNDDRILFLFIGGGRKSAELQSFASTRKLQNVKFLGYVAREDLAYSISAANVSVVTEHPSVTGLLLPSKTYGILASGRPIIFVGAPESDVARIVQDAHCGVMIRHDDPDSLEATIQQFIRDPFLIDRMGSASRRASETTYSRKSATTRWSNALKSILPSDKAFAVGRLGANAIERNPTANPDATAL
jgi:colanic acid biosynthesis glycosyl transferase WcaI